MKKVHVTMSVVLPLGVCWHVVVYVPDSETTRNHIEQDRSLNNVVGIVSTDVFIGKPWWKLSVAGWVQVRIAWKCPTTRPLSLLLR